MFKPKITKEEVNNMPLVVFDGEIILVDEPSKIQDAISDLRQQTIVGVDTETKPSFVRGVHHKVSLVQVSTIERCYLFRLNKIPFPKELADFFSDKNICKIGLALKDDFIGLNRQYKFKPANIVDIQSIAKNYGILEMGLQKVFAIIFGRKVSKSQRLTNWENPELTSHQQMYAATDAWASLLIYLQLIKQKKLSKKEIEKIVMEVAAAEQSNSPTNTSQN